MLWLLPSLLSFRRLKGWVDFVGEWWLKSGEESCFELFVCSHKNLLFQGMM